MATTEPNGQLWANRAAGLLIAALGAYLALAGLGLGLSSETTTLGPGGFPVVTGLLLCGLGLTLVWQARAEAREPSEDAYLPSRDGWLKLVVTVASVVLFCALLNVIGYVPAMFILLLLLSLFVSRMRVWLSVAVAAGFSLTSFYMFYVGLGVPLPTSALLPLPTFGH